MMSRRQHVDALCRILEARLAAAPPRLARRLLRPQVRWAANRPDDDELAKRLGVIALVEECRNEHLATLDADDGLGALDIPWSEVAVAFELTQRVSERRTHG